jgi:hypothetical protein
MVACTRYGCFMVAQSRYGCCRVLWLLVISYGCLELALLWLLELHPFVFVLGTASLAVRIELEGTESELFKTLGVDRKAAKSVLFCPLTLLSIEVC